MNIPKLSMDFHIPNPPKLLFTETEFEPLEYEDTIFKRQADDIKKTFEQQIYTLQDIAQSAQVQAESASTQIIVLKEQLAFAKSEAQDAKKEALFSKIIAILAIIISIGAIIVPLLF